MNLPSSELAPALIECTGPRRGHRHELSFGAQVIGRAGEATIELDDRDVSRRHAQLEVTADRITVEDLGSKNGVFARGRRIEGAVRLSHGDRFDIGGVTLEVDHIGAKVGEVLAAGGETTMTRPASYAVSDPRRRGLLLPVLGIVLFGGLVVALVLFG